MPAVARSGSDSAVICWAPTEHLNRAAPALHSDRKLDRLTVDMDRVKRRLDLVEEPT